MMWLLTRLDWRFEQSRWAQAEPCLVSGNHLELGWFVERVAAERGWRVTPGRPDHFGRSREWSIGPDGTALTLFRATQVPTYSDSRSRLSVGELVDTLHTAADGRDEYADSGGFPDTDLLRTEANAFRRAADLIEAGTETARRDLIYGTVPSWRWVEFGIEEAPRRQR
jgi:hypothetical protein